VFFEPRVLLMKEAARRVSKEGDMEKFKIADRIESAWSAWEGIAGFDWFVAVTYHAMKIPAELIAPLLAISKACRWSALAIEQCANVNGVHRHTAYMGSPARSTTSTRIGN
jgi:citrate synthase